MQIFGRASVRVGALSLGLALALGGCGSSGGGGGGAGPISSDPLSGKIGSQPWTIATAETDSFLSDTDHFAVNAYSESFTPCTGTPSTGQDELLLKLPKVVGTYALGVDLIQVFYVASTNYNYGATSGQIVISDVSATTISGGVSFAYNADNSVNGQFQATICP